MDLEVEGPLRFESVVAVELVATRDFDLEERKVPFRDEKTPDIVHLQGGQLQDGFIRRIVRRQATDNETGDLRKDLPQAHV